MADEKPAQDEEQAAAAAKAKDAEPEKPAAAKAKEPKAETTEEPKAEAAEKPKRSRRSTKAQDETKTEAEAKAAEASKAEDAEKPKRTRRGAAAKVDEKSEKAAAPASESKPARAKRSAKTSSSAAKAPSTRSRTRAGHASDSGRRTVVRAQAKYVRTSARKARIVCGHLRGKSVAEARAILAFTPRQVARDWGKLLDSAVANAENNHELVEEDLIVHEAYADEGPTIKRFRPRARGRASSIRKRTSHLTITLTPGR